MKQISILIISKNTLDSDIVHVFLLEFEGHGARCLTMQPIEPIIWNKTFFVNGPMMLVNAKNGFTTNLKTQQCCKWLWTTINSHGSGHSWDYMS